MKRNPRVLVVEDEAIVALHLQARLKGLGYEVTAIAASGEEALKLARDSNPDLILMDIRIQGDIDGIETASRLAPECTAPVVYLSAYSEDATLERARSTGPYGYLLKPFSERELHATLQMALERRRLDLDLARSEDRLKLALDAADMGLWDLDPATGNVEVGDRTGEILGLATKMGRATREALIACVQAEDRVRAETELAKCSDRQSRCDAEMRRSNPEGETRWIRTQAMRDDRGHVIGVVRDITTQKRSETALKGLNQELERMVGLRTAELEATIGELDAFSYSVAHDLRSPVRAIVGFSRILMEDAADELSEQSKGSLERVHTAGMQMSRMIDALLELSRIRRVALHRQPVDIGALAAEIAHDLESSDRTRAVQFEFARGVIAWMDPDLARIVMWNLLENAWKFSSKRAEARIEVGTLPSDEECVFFVRDNGAGFDPAHGDKLFRAFERLHRTDEFAGTGIGLTTVRRIVQRHDGRIWAEGRPNAGATFYVAVPKHVETPPR